jgi:hypothetical protein
MYDSNKRRAQYLKHKDAILKQKKQYESENTEQIAAYQASYYDGHAEEIRKSACERMRKLRALSKKLEIPPHVSKSKKTRKPHI